MGRDSFSVTRARRCLRAPWYISIIYIADLPSICKSVLILSSTTYLHHHCLLDTDIELSSQTSVVHIIPLGGW